MQRVLVVGANPAWQKTLSFSRFVPGAVNRALRASATPGGKGVNFCRAARCHGAAATRLFHFSGGDTGRQVDAALTAVGVELTAVPVPGETRVCTTLLDETGGMTELIEPSATVPPAAARALLAALEAALAEGGVAVVAMVGTLPGATDVALYRDVARLTVGAGKKFLLDAASGAAAALDVVRDFEGVLWKVNREEFARALGVDVGTGEGDDAKLAAALEEAGRRWPRAAIAVTDGPAPAWLRWAGRAWRYRIARPEKIVSPLGCGDTAAAAWLGEVLRGAPVPEAFAHALGAASANCLSALCGEFAPADAARLRAAMTEWGGPDGSGGPEK